MPKIIVSDTSCLIALSNIDMLGLLKDLYSEIIVTPEVEAEFGENLPEWFIVLKVRNTEKQIELSKRLDLGESSSIILATEIKNSILIIDEIKGRKIAKSFEIEIIGTVGILLLAYKMGLIKDIMGLIQKLLDNGFRLSPKIMESLHKKYGE